LKPIVIDIALRVEHFREFRFITPTFHSIVQDAILVGHIRIHVFVFETSGKRLQSDEGQLETEIFAGRYQLI